MISICEHIEYLIHRHDCVVVAGWGAFIAQYQPACIDKDTGMIRPPVRTIAFNPSVSHNDGLLASSIMRRESIGYDAAIKMISAEVDVFRHQLESEKELAMGRIGVFHRNDDGLVSFEPYASGIVSAEFLGLPSVAITLCREDDKEETPRRKDVIYVPVSRNLFKIAASLLLLIGLGITLSTPIVLDNQTDYASISTPKVTVQSVELPAFDRQESNAELFIALPDEAEAVAVVDTLAAEERKEILTPAVEMLRCVDSDSYCLVVASLASRELAEEYISERGDVAMRILEAGGKYRVYVATGETSSQAMAIMQTPSFAEKYQAAWICRR